MKKVYNKMFDCYDGVFKLDPSTPLFLQVLKLAGWHTGRNADISQVEDEYRKSGYILTDFARKTISEFYGLCDSWFFLWELPDGQVRIGGYDYEFSTTDICGEYDDKKLLPPDVRDAAVPIIIAGWHQFGSPVWIGENNTLYRINVLNEQNEGLETFSSVFELLESDMNLQFRDFNTATENLYVTFDHPTMMLYWEKYEAHPRGALAADIQ